MHCCLNTWYCLILISEYHTPSVVCHNTGYIITLHLCQYLWLQDHYLWIYTWHNCHTCRKLIWYYTYVWNVFSIIFWFDIWSSYHFTNRYWVIWEPCCSDWPVIWNARFFSRTYRTDLWYYNHSYWAVVWNT